MWNSQLSNKANSQLTSKYVMQNNGLHGKCRVHDEIFTKQTSQHDVIKIYIQFLIWVLLLLFTLFTKLIICKQTFALSLLQLLHFFNTRNIKTKNETSHIHLNEKSGLMIHNAVTIYSFFFFSFFLTFTVRSVCTFSCFFSPLFKLLFYHILSSH